MRVIFAIVPVALGAANCAATAGAPSVDAKATFHVSGNIVDTAKLGKGSLAACRDGGPDSAEACEELEEELDLIIKSGDALRDRAQQAGGDKK